MQSRLLIEVTAGFSDNNKHYSRAPHHHHHHHHHHHDDRYRHVHFGRSPHHHHHHYNGNGDKVIVSGNHDHVRVGRSPRPHHHHDDHDGYHTKVVVSGDHDHVRFDRSPDGLRDFEDGRVTSRDNDHVHLQRSVFIAGEQGRSFVVPRVARRTSTQELFTLGKRSNDLGGVPGHIDIMVRSFLLGAKFVNCIQTSCRARTMYLAASALLH